MWRRHCTTCGLDVVHQQLTPIGEIRNYGNRWMMLGSGSRTVVELDMAWNTFREEAIQARQFLDRDRWGQEMEELLGVQGGW